MNGWRRAAAVAVAWAALVEVGRAEIVIFEGGRSLSVSGHRFEGDSIVLSLRGGGEVACAASLIAEILPDEVPVPDPVSGSVGAAGVMAGAPYGDLIERMAASHGVDPRLVHAVIQVESRYRVDARSPKGAMGLMQLMPETAKRYEVDNPYDPEANVAAGVRHLRSLLERFEVPLALAAYNAGEAAVERYGGIPPYEETLRYVQRVLSLVGPSHGPR